MKNCREVQKNKTIPVIKLGYLDRSTWFVNYLQGIKILSSFLISQNGCSKHVSSVSFFPTTTHDSAFGFTLMTDDISTFTTSSNVLVSTLNHLQ